MLRRLLWVFVVVAALIGGALAMLFLYPRPSDTTAPAVFAGDGADLDYCRLPELDGSGPAAADIPKAYTPGCGWESWPMPVLADCTEPLAEGVEDLRGLWRGMPGSRDVPASSARDDPASSARDDPTSSARDHVERIEQCGDRTVVTAAGIIHDFHTDGTLRNGSRDVEPPRCMNTWVAIEWENGVMKFRPFGLPFVAATRLIQDEQLIWTYPGAGELRMDRICRVPESHRERGRRNEDNPLP